MTYHTLQEVFDHVAAKLLEQGARCEWPAPVDTPGEVGDLACAFHNPSGQRCAVGWLVPETWGVPRFGSLPALIDQLADRGVVPYTAKAILCGLAGVHDCYEPSAWPDELRALGEWHGMTLPACLREPELAEVSA
jgi:hypothetical protein